ncbi:MAG: hypothetical protein M3R58_00190 [Pseudomonadota bacterium]|nr:hypothetical protein [Pseudomonadota bacterium]
MKIAIWLASFVVGTVIFIVSCYFVISLVVAYLKVTGAVEGERMFHDFRTPSWIGLLAFQAVCAAVLGVDFFLRAKLQKRRISNNSHQGALR